MTEAKEMAVGSVHRNKEMRSYNSLCLGVQMFTNTDESPSLE